MRLSFFFFFLYIRESVLYNMNFKSWEMHYLHVLLCHIYRILLKLCKDLLSSCIRNLAPKTIFKKSTILVCLCLQQKYLDISNYLSWGFLRGNTCFNAAIVNTSFILWKSMPVLFNSYYWDLSSAQFLLSNSYKAKLGK